MNLHRILHIAILAVATLISACTGRSAASSAATASTGAPAAVSVPRFSADSAYAYVAAQVDMGPRVPGTKASAECAEWIEATLRRHGADTVIVQRTSLPDPMNPSRSLPVVNILGRFNPEAKNKVMLAAHYDTRPVADEETDAVRAATPIPGANDGGSGVGVMLEIARMMAADRPQTGVDLLFVDLEDSGSSGSDDYGVRARNISRPICLMNQSPIPPPQP